MLDISRFVKVLALAGSNADGEALAALRTAQRMLRAANMSFTDIAQSLENGVPVTNTGDELARLRLELADAIKLIGAYRKELDQLRASRSASTGGNLKRTRAAIAATMRGILNDPRLSRLSDREIARRTGLSPQSVGNWRKRIEAERASKERTVHNGRRRRAA
jgi:hypothetical protein